MVFVANFIRFPRSHAKILKIGLRFDTVTDSLKVGTFLRHSVCQNPLTHFHSSLNFTLVATLTFIISSLILLKVAETVVTVINLHHSALPYDTITTSMTNDSTNINVPSVLDLSGRWRGLTLSGDIADPLPY